MKTIYRTKRAFEKDTSEETVMDFCFFLEDVEWWERGDGVFKNRPVATIIRLYNDNSVYIVEDFEKFHKLMEAFNSCRAHPLLTQN